MTRLHAVLGAAGTGKQMPNTTLVLTPDGYKQLGTLQVGDYVIGDDGNPTKIISITPTKKLKSWKFIFKDGTTATSCKEHNWRVQTKKLKSLGKWKVLQTKDMLDKINNYRNFKSKKGHYYEIPVVKPVNFNSIKPLELDPYLLGCFLGDGYFCKSGLVKFAVGFKEELEWANLISGYYKAKVSPGSTCLYYIFPQYKQEIISLGLNCKTRQDKFIPKEYLFSSIENRLSLLQGLMDTDGSVFKKQSNSIRVCFSNCNKNIVDGVVWLVQSLGGLATVKLDKRNKYRTKVCYEVSIQLNNFNPFRLPRKANLWKQYTIKNPSKKIVRAEYVGEIEGRCLQVDNKNRCYVVEDFVVTHNSFMINEIIAQDPYYGFRTATTGIAAVNMDGVAGVQNPTTINSALRYFNAEDLLRKYTTGKTLFPLKLIGSKFRNIIIDEISLINGGVLDLIVLAIEEYNAQYKKDLGLLVVGDSAQLPPVEGAPFFEAKSWPRFKVKFLTEIKRQKDIEFITALNQIRKGDIKQAAEWLEANITFTKEVDYRFKGTTFFPTNAEVIKFNRICLQQLKGEAKEYKAVLEGRADPTWKSIPQSLTLKRGCLIQLLYNDFNLGFANGDTAIVNDMWDNSLYITLLRKNKMMYLRPRVLEYFSSTEKGYLKKKPEGKLTLLHVKLSSAVSIHKAQGLTIDNVQLCLNGPGIDFLSRQSGMLYTALSRVKTPEGLTIVGNIDNLINCCYIKPEYLKWIK